MISIASEQLYYQLHKENVTESSVPIGGQENQNQNIEVIELIKFMALTTAILRK